MANPSYTVSVDGFQILCDSPESVFALLRASKKSSPVTVTTSAAPAAAPKAAPTKVRKMRRGRRGRRAAAATKAKSKSSGISPRGIALLREIAKSGGAPLAADRLSKAAGLKGAKGVGGAMTSLSKELKAMGRSINEFIVRLKTPNGTVWSAAPNCSQAFGEIQSMLGSST